MSKRYTTTDVHNALERLARAHKAAGITYTERGGQTFTWEHLTVSPGSSTYGRAWRLHYRDPRTGGLYTLPVLGVDFLGMTAREAYAHLSAQAAGIELAVEFGKAVDR